MRKAWLFLLPVLSGCGSLIAGFTRPFGGVQLDLETLSNSKLYLSFWEKTFLIADIPFSFAMDLILFPCWLVRAILLSLF